MSSREELLAAAKRKRLLEMAQAKRASEMAPSPPADRGGVDAQDVKGLANAVSNGFLAGFGDEVIAGARGYIDSLLPNAEYDFGEDVVDNRGDDYGMYLADQRAVDDEFRIENPGTAIVAEIAGSIASPINKVAPGIGRTGSGLRRTLESIGRGAVEGGIVGFGEGRGSIDDRLQNAGTGASIGGLMSGALTGGMGALGKAASKRRVVEELGQGENFKPIWLADPAGVPGKFYKNVVGNAIGARGVLGRQESRYFRNNPKIASLVDNPATMFPDTLGTRASLDSAIGEVTNKGRVATDTVSRGIKNIADTTQAVKATVPARKAVIAAQREAQKQALDAGFHPQVIETALPSSMPDDVKQAIRGLPPFEAEKKLSEWYRKNGFQMVKGRVFEWDEGLGREIKNLSENDPAFALTLGDAASKVDGLVQILIKQGKKATDIVPEDYIAALSSNRVSINGDALMALRNAFTIPANSGGPSFKGSKLRDVASKFDDLIKRQLGEKSPEWLKYQDEIAKWGNKQGISAAALKAKKALQDTYTPGQLARSLKKAGPESDAWRIAKETEDAKKAIPKKVTTQDTGVGPELARLKKTGRLLNNRKKRISQRTRAATNRINTQRSEIINDNPTAITQFGTTAILGIPFGFGVGTIPAGMATARALSTEGVQRSVAGQTAAQKALADAIRRGATAPVTRNISRGSVLAMPNREEEQY